MNIFESITAVQSDVDFIGKDKKAEKQNYKYRGVDQVLNTLHPLFAKHKVFAVPEVLEIAKREIRETKSGGEMTYQVAKIKYTFYAEDGTNISAIVLGEAMDSGDKVSNKCMSVAYKYACFQILSIPTEETAADPDDACEEFAKTKNGHTMPEGTPPERKRGITTEELKNFGVEDPEATAAALEKKLGKKISDFDERETEAVWALLNRKKLAKEAQEELRRKFDECQDPLPWEGGDDQGQDT